MRVKILSTADDLEEGYCFYESQSDGRGTYFPDTLYSDIDSLACFAGMHHLVLGYHRLLSRLFHLQIIYIF
jgi:hypothetical protein